MSYGAWIVSRIPYGCGPTSKTFFFLRLLAKTMKVRAAEMPLLVKFMSCKHEDLLDPEHPHNSQIQLYTSVIPALGRGRQEEDPGALLASQSNQTSKHH